MKSHESIETAIDGKTIEHAKRQRKSPSLLHKWQEPSTDFEDSGRINPLDRVETIIETSISLGTSREKALAPADYLEHRFGRVAITLPQDIGTPEEESKELLRLMKEVGDIVRCHNAATEDLRVSKQDFKDVDREIWEAANQLMVYRESIRRAAK